MLGYTGFWICLNIPWIVPHYLWLSLNMSKYAWISWNMCEYALICYNGFYSTFIHCNSLSTWTRDYLFQRLRKTRSYSLKKHEAIFLKRQNLIFWIVGGIPTHEPWHIYRLNRIILENTMNRFKKPMEKFTVNAMFQLRNMTFYVIFSILYTPWKF